LSTKLSLPSSSTTPSLTLIVNLASEFVKSSYNIWKFLIKLLVS
jgi:hypothetical protein